MTQQGVVNRLNQYFNLRQMVNLCWNGLDRYIFDSVSKSQHLTFIFSKLKAQYQKNKTKKKRQTKKRKSNSKQLKLN